jgi:hypothetical protein
MSQWETVAEEIATFRGTAVRASNITCFDGVGEQGAEGGSDV